MDPQLGCIFPVPILFHVISFCERREKKTCRCVCKVLLQDLDGYLSTNLMIVGAVPVNPSLQSEEIRLFFIHKHQVVLATPKNRHVIFDATRVQSLGIVHYVTRLPISPKLLKNRGITSCAVDEKRGIIYFSSCGSLFSIHDGNVVKFGVRKGTQGICFDVKNDSLYFIDRTYETIFYLKQASNGQAKSLKTLDYQSSIKYIPIAVGNGHVYFITSQGANQDGTYIHCFNTETRTIKLIHIEWDIKKFEKLKMIADESRECLYLLLRRMLLRVSIHGGKVSSIDFEEIRNKNRTLNFCDLVLHEKTGNLFILDYYGLLWYVPVDHVDWRYCE